MTEQPDLPPELLERVAKIIAPHLEGGREFDQMPPGRVALRKWRREGMCSTNDATQDDALEVARAVAPLLIAHGRELAEADHSACNRNVYRLQLGGVRLCDALRRIEETCTTCAPVARKALDHNEPEPRNEHRSKP